MVKDGTRPWLKKRLNQGRRSNFNKRKGDVPTWTSKTELGNCNGTIGVITDSTPIRVSFNVPGDIVDLEIGSIVNYFTINGNSASRRQFPLQNCYGLTVKTQGLTLRDVSLNLDGQNFSAGQAYVAPSRCSSWERVQIATLDRSAFITDSEVIAELPVSKASPKTRKTTSSV